MGTTLRGDINGGGTLRGNADPNNNGGTLRGEAPKEGTLRGEAPKGGTLRGETPQGGTLRGSSDKKGGTMRGDAAKQQQNAPVENLRFLKKEIQSSEITSFELNGVTYAVDGVISASTGEAEIYKVRNGSKVFALKLYYAGIVPDKDVTEVLENASGTGFIVDLVDHGVWISNQGEKRYFELQPYYSGGVLRAGMMAGNGSALKGVAVAMLMGVKTAHDHNMLHRDIKPDNFLYVNDNHTQLVLCDFGISSVFKRDAKGGMLPLKTNAQFRTKIYSAPETYTMIDGIIEYDDVKSDYYSLGVTLLTLWMGEDKFAACDERTLLRMKKGENGSLPMADDMPDELKHLISGLTVPNPDKRWGFDEVERWLKGEDVAVEGLQQSQSASTLNILWSGSKNQTARSLEELASLMLDDNNLAAQYMYSGKISRWLSDGNYPELAMQIDEFVNKIYPKNQQSGVMAAVYLLDADMPYISPTGKRLATQHEIADDMAHNVITYMPLVADSDSSLYVYFRAGGMDLSSKFALKGKKDDLESYKATWRLILTLNPASPFPMSNPLVPKTSRLVYTVEEMVDFFATLPENCYDNTTSTSPYLLFDEAFILWLSYRDAALAGKIKSKLAQEPAKLQCFKNSQLYYYVMYLLDPERNFSNQKDQTTLFTIDQIAELLNNDLLGYYVLGRHENDYHKYDVNLARVNQLVNLQNNRLYYYLKAKELYKDKFDYIAYCYEINSKDNQRKAGPYNLEIATFKALKALNNGSVFYYFPKSGKAVSTVDELSGIPHDELRDELDNGMLKWWLAVQYQEDPFADLSEHYAYESLLSDYTSKLIDINDELEEGQRMVEAYQIVNDNAAKCRGLARSVKIWRVVWGLVVALPLLGVAVASIVGGIPQFANPSGLTAWGVLAAVFALNLRIVQIFPKTDEWLLEPFGEDLGDTLLCHRWIVSAIYGVAIAGMMFLLETWGYSWGKYLLAALSLGVIAWRYIRCIHEFPLMEQEYDEELNPGDEALVVEPLFYAWKDKGKNNSFDSQTIEEQTKFINGTRDERASLIKRIAWSLIPVALIVSLYGIFSPAYADYIKKTDPERWEKVFGEGGTSVQDVETTRYYADVKTSLAVRSEPSADAKRLGNLRKGEQFDVIENSGEFAKIKYAGGVGYVKASYIKPIESAAEGDNASDKKSASMRREKNEGRATADQEVTETKTDGGAISYEPVEQLPSQAVSKKYTILPNYTTVNIFSRQSTQLDYVVGQIKNGEQFEVLDNGSGRFAKISYNGETVYIQRQYIIPVE